jgi:CheY-like chemotaxis protein
MAALSFPNATAPDPTSEGPLVVIVDDDEDTRFVYAELLTHLGYRTAGEETAKAGIEAAFRLRPDVILMDVAMPGMNGVEAVRILKADPRTCNCFIVVVTGSGVKWYAEARDAGCDAFFGKPFDPSALEYALRPATVSPDPGVPLPADVVKRCTCGREYTRAQWLALPRCGRMNLARRGSVVEVRNCPCGSSMALPLDESGASDEGGTELPRPALLRNLLVVDRDTHVRRLVLHFVGNAYVVEFADDGYAALDRVRKSPPAALVADLMIPRLDGLALCRLLKGDAATARVPVLLFSVLAAGDRAAKAGADAFVAKPLDRERFVAALLRLTEPDRSGLLPIRDRES